MDRRGFFKTMGVVAATALPAQKLFAENEESKQELYGILIDTTRCAGCQNCSVVCAESNGLPEPDLDAMFEGKVRVTSENQWTLVNSYDVDGQEIYVKTQCMHCNQPACATACPTKAMHKTPQGPVIWRADKCMGCRYCMISCPFNIPKFEYNSLMPKIQKCVMCWERLKNGEQPACVENCPEEAIIFGKRRDLIEEARTRIYTNPGQYVSHIYGEHEVGGTGVIYLSAVPFEKLGFQTNLGNKAYPEYTKTFLYSVPFVITLWPAFLLALRESTKKKSITEGKESEDE